ncbi:MAG: HAMP domain-containing histidine kinase [Solobacterium sp.]|nr:HAMP domain-containing histidine kinase [Solobacterium sp.]
MKRIRMWLRELTLTQQLLTIVFLFIVIFAVFVFVFLSPSIDRFSETEMYNLLHNSQTTMIAYMDNNPGTFPSFDTNPDVVEYLYNPATGRMVSSDGSEANHQLREKIETIATGDLAGTVDDEVSIQAEGSESLVQNLFCITQLKDGTYLVSVMANSYRVQFQQSLVNGVVMLNLLFVSALFVFLMLWVGTLIIPLAQIKNYVTKIKNDDQGAVLNIRRNDEIGEVADALVEMQAELERQNREKEEMIQNISHDLKTPIATIKSYSEAIKDGIYPYETLEKSVDVIIEHANRLEKKVHSLIILNKMGYLLDDCEEGETLPVADVIDRTILSLKVIRPEISFIRELDENVKFHGEEEPWRIVVENLIDNALRYAKTFIRITLKDGELRVINDGPKIDEEVAAKMFRPYEKGSDGQFGLGLSIVYRVATTYGYKASAENLTEGVCFRIARDSSRREKTRRSRGSERRKKKTPEKQVI